MAKEPRVLPAGFRRMPVDELLGMIDATLEDLATPRVPLPPLHRDDSTGRCVRDGQPWPCSASRER